MTTPDPFVVAIIAGQEQRFALERLAVCRIGRSAHSTIVLDDALASREHAMIRRDAGGHCVLSDSGSRNGTTLNGRPVTAPTRLADGDVIRVGAQKLAFHRAGSGAGPEEEREGTASPATMIHFANSLVSVLVIDIRDYTVLARELGEERISALMSEIFREAGGLLARNGSWSQKFIGDAVMGLWVHNQPQITAREFATIIDSLAQLHELVARKAQQFALVRPLAFGAAINTGYAQIGNMGSAAISDFTALGDTVNKAFRLETASKDLRCELVIGRSSLDFLSPPLPREQLPPIDQAWIKGYDAPEPVFRLMMSDLPRLAGLVTGADAPAGMAPQE